MRWFNKKKNSGFGPVAETNERTQQMTPSAVVVNTDVRGVLLDLANEKKELLKTAKDLEAQIKLLPSQRPVILFNKLDPVIIEKDLRLQLSNCETEINQVHEKMLGLYQSNSKILSSRYQDEFPLLHDNFVKPKADSCSKPVESFGTFVEQILAASLESVATLDTERDDWNALGDSLGVPTNFKVVTPPRLSDSVRDSLRNELKPHLQSFQNKINRLHEHIGMELVKTKAEWAKPEPTPARQPLPANHAANWPRDLLRKPDGSNFPD